MENSFGRITDLLEKLKNILEKSSRFIFPGTMLWVFLTSLIWLLWSYWKGIPFFFYKGIYDRPINPWIVFAFSIFLFLLLLALAGHIRRKDKFLPKNAARILFAGLFLLQILFSVLYHVTPSQWDFGIVSRCADEFSMGLNPFGHYFVDDYPNNIGITLLLGNFFKLSRAVGITDMVAAGIFLNITFIDISIMLLYHTARKLFSPAGATLLLVMSILFTPFITYAPIYYSDTLSLPFSTGICCFYLLSLRKTGRTKFLYLMASSLCSMAAIIIKPYFFIAVIAVILHMLMKNRFREVLKHAVPYAALLALLLAFYYSLLFYTRLIPIPYSQAGYPFTHWMMMGLKEPYGFYNARDVSYTESFSTKEARNQADLKVIGERLRSYGMAGLLQLFNRKLIFTWMDGTYFAPVKLNRGVLAYRSWHKYILPLESGSNKAYIYYSQSLQLVILLTMLLSGFSGLTRDGKGAGLLCSLALTGFTLFLMVFETRSRYLIGIAPFILLCSSDGLNQLSRSISHRLSGFHGRGRIVH